MFNTSKLLSTPPMTDRIIVCSTDDDFDPEWKRQAIWEDGEWVSGDAMLPGSIYGDELTAEEILDRLDGPRTYAFPADEAPV